MSVNSCLIPYTVYCQYLMSYGMLINFVHSNVKNTINLALSILGPSFFGFIINISGATFGSLMKSIGDMMVQITVICGQMHLLQGFALTEGKNVPRKYDLQLGNKPAKGKPLVNHLVGIGSIWRMREGIECLEED